MIAGREQPRYRHGGLAALVLVLGGCGGEAPERACSLAYATRSAGQLVASSRPAAGPGSCALTLPDDVRAGEQLPVRDRIEPSRTERVARFRFTTDTGEALEATRGSVTVEVPGPPTFEVTVDAFDDEDPGRGSVSARFSVPIL